MTLSIVQIRGYVGRKIVAPVSLVLSGTMVNGKRTIPAGATYTTLTDANGYYSITVPANEDLETYPPSTYYTATCQAASYVETFSVPATDESSVAGNTIVAPTDIGNAQLGTDGTVGGPGGSLLTPSVGNASRSVQWVAPATGVGATDRANVQAAHDALPSTGGKIVLGNGTYVFDATGVTFSKPNITLEGAGGVLSGVGTNASPEGNAATTITYPSATGTAINCTGTGGYDFKAFLLMHTSVLASGPTPTAGAGIAINTAQSCSISGVTVCGFWNNVYMYNGHEWTISRCWILDPVNYGVYVGSANTGGLPDTGQFQITGCFTDMYFTARNPAAWVRWESGGGAQIFSNRFNAGPIPGNSQAGNVTVALDFMLQDGAGSTGNIHIANNEINAFVTAGVRLGTLDTTTPTSMLALALIVGNSFDVAEGGGAGIGVIVGTVAGTSYYNTARRVSITGNSFVALTTSIKVLCGQWVHIGPNFHEGISGSAIVIGGTGYFAGVLGLSVDRQTFFSDNLENVGRTLWTDWRADNSYGEESGVVEHRYKREMLLTTAGTWVTQYQIGTYSYQSGGGFTLRITGNDPDDGAFYFEQRRAWTSTSTNGTPALTTIGTDVAVGAGCANLNIQYVLASNLITIQAQVIGGTSHAPKGACEIDVFGMVQSIYQA